MKKQVLIALLLAGLAGCSTESAQMSNLAMKHKMDAQKAAQAKETLSQAPDWYLKPPSGDYGLWGAGTAVSNDLQFALDKARVQALARMAESYKAKVSALRKSYKAEGQSSDSRVRGEDSSTVDLFVPEADLSGAVVKKQVVRQEGTGYRAYVLAFYPLGETNLVKAARAKRSIAQSDHQEAQTADQALMHRVKDESKAGGAPTAASAAAN